MTIRHRPIRAEIVSPDVGPSYAFERLTKSQRAARWLSATPARLTVLNALIACALAAPLRIWGIGYAAAFFFAALSFVGGWSLARLHWRKTGEVPPL